MRLRARNGVWLRCIAACQGADSDVTAGWLHAELGVPFKVAQNALAYAARSGRLRPVARGVYRA